MTPYKGIVRIACKSKGCHRDLREPDAGCLNCLHGRVEILELDGKVKETLNRPRTAVRVEKAPGKRRKAGGRRLEAEDKRVKAN